MAFLVGLRDCRLACRPAPPVHEVAVVEELDFNAAADFLGVVPELSIHRSGLFSHPPQALAREVRDAGLRLTSRSVPRRGGHAADSTPVDWKGQAWVRLRRCRQEP